MKKMRRKALSLIMTLAMITTLFAGLTISASASTVITDLSQITNMSGDYKLADSVTTLNIDASTWTPIGSSSDPFTGTFDGNGKTITWSGTTSGQSYYGIFGKSTGTVKNFTTAGSFTVTGSNLDR